MYTRTSFLFFGHYVLLRANPLHLPLFRLPSSIRCAEVQKHRPVQASAQAARNAKKHRASGAWKHLDLSMSMFTVNTFWAVLAMNASPLTPVGGSLDSALRLRSNGLRLRQKRWRHPIPYDTYDRANEAVFLLPLISAYTSRLFFETHKVVYFYKSGHLKPTLNQD